MNPFLAMIMIFAGNFPPQGWAFCDGQLLSIAQNQALFSLLGTTYGGDGQTTFALPDLRGRVPIHMGQGPGLSNYFIGEIAGTENITLTINNMPQHNHVLNATSEQGSTSDPSGAYLGNTGALDREYNTSGTIVQMNPNVVGPKGGSQPFGILQPFLTLNFVIALQGIYPSRN